jgi:hypothetical protein
VENPREVFRTSQCAGCGGDLKVCLNCSFHQPGAQWDCGEHVEEPVREKDRANFCSHFRFRDGPSSPPDRGPVRPGARKDFDKLFGGS